MTRREETRRLTRLLKDFLIGLGAFALVFLAASGDGSSGAWSILAEVANAGEMASSDVIDTFDMIDAQLALSEPVYRDTDRGTAILILALVFSSIVAFNLWFFRHLRRVYALHSLPSPNRSTVTPTAARRS
jgi:hypothetical protein